MIALATSLTALLFTFGFLLALIVRYAFTYGHRTRNMPPGLCFYPELTTRKGLLRLATRPTDLAVHRQLASDAQGQPLYEVRDLPKKPCTAVIKVLTEPADRLTEWAREYGGIYALKLGNGTMAVITDRRLVKEVVDKKSGIYSHRPPSYVLGDLITKGHNLLIMDYGNQWRLLRRLVHQHFMEPMVDNHHNEIVDAEAVQLVHDYMTDPEHHIHHPKRYSNSITNTIGWYLPSCPPSPRGGRG